MNFLTFEIKNLGQKLCAQKDGFRKLGHTVYFKPLHMHNCANKDGFHKSSHILYGYMNRQPNNINNVHSYMCVHAYI